LSSTRRIAAELCIYNSREKRSVTEHSYTLSPKSPDMDGEKFVRKSPVPTGIGNQVRATNPANQNYILVSTYSSVRMLCISNIRC